LRCLQKGPFFDVPRRISASLSLRVRITHVLKVAPAVFAFGCSHNVAV
jgi:hypothetical protein